MCATLNDAKPSTLNIRGINLAAVERATIQVTELPLQQKPSTTGYDRLYKAWSDTGHVEVKVNFTLEQATKVQRGSRGIALLFL